MSLRNARRMSYQRSGALEMSSFLGVPGGNFGGGEDTSIGIVGAPVDRPYSGLKRPPCAEAPGVLRERSVAMSRFVGNYDFDLGQTFRVNGVADYGDLCRQSDPPEVASRRIAEAVTALTTDGVVPIVLGGDDSIPIPVLRGLRSSGPLTVVQFDAHLDYRDEVEGSKEGYSSAMRRAAEMPWVRQILQIGLRGVGSAREDDADDARKNGNVLVPAAAVRERGGDYVLALLPAGEKCFISLDCDVLDPAVCPAVRSPVPGGLEYYRLAELVRGFAVRGRIVGMSISEFAPSLDTSGLSGLVVVRLITQVLQALLSSRPESGQSE